MDASHQNTTYLNKSSQLIDAYQSDVVIVNMHGGCPNSLWMRALSELAAFRYLRDTSTVYTNVASRSTVPEASLFELITGGAKHNIIDRSYRQQSRDHDPSLSLFHQFKQKANYSVHLKGCFGIDPSLNPFSHPSQSPNACSRLAAYGIDEFECSDSAFTCQSAAGNKQYTNKQGILSYAD
eukprot:6193694-Pleurochrysis_carterae.AAC.1